MIKLLDVSIQSQIYESANSLVYRAIRELERLPIILKVLKENYPTPQELARYRTEYQITKSLNIPGVVKVYDLQKYQNTLVMFLEDFGGESLKIWMKKRYFSLGEFLEIAIKTTQILGKIHAANIIHKDINPANIVFNSHTGELKIIDFGISTQLTRENTTLKNPNILEGTLNYISPEQTGRMNRALDYRTDFYSLGVTFYEMLTGQLPFSTNDPLELVHCHIAKQPIFPSEIKPEIPLIISKIILKLMAKNADQRYQSAVGITADLEESLKQLKSQEIISEFPLSIYDISDKFQLPQKLYGREKEIETLLSAFERATIQQSELILVAGYSGVGKTALVQEIYKPITEKRGYFIKGKFDQFQRNIPYSAVVNAFKELIKQLLAETETDLNQWREEILTAVGVNGQIIIDVIPEVELIIGKQAPVPELGPNESQNRFNFVFQNFITIFTKPEHPLVLFLDDLQWADGASLKLMQLLMNSASRGLFLIGAYRDNEVSPAHPLMLTLDEITKKNAIIEHIYISNLDLLTVSQFLCNALKIPSEKVIPLAKLLFVKTGGNPFFLSEFLKSLYTEGLLKFDHKHRIWIWDINDIEKRGFTDNVVELMTGKIQKLPLETQKLLTVGAAIGNQFDVNLVSTFVSINLRDVVNSLDIAVRESLVLPLDTRENIELALLGTSNYQLPEYKFIHDRIQQAAYALIPEAEKPILHQKIGQILIKTNSPEQQEENIFDIVNQFNFGIQLIEEQSERDELAKLNLIAGKKAKTAIAYESALSYFQTGLDLLTDNSWNNNYELTLSLYEEYSETAYLQTEFALMEKLINDVLNRAKTVLDKVKVYEVKILASNAQAKFKDAIDIALEVLKLLQVKLPKNPKNLDVFWSLLQVKLRIGFRPINSLTDLPIMTNPYAKAAIRILSQVTISTYFVNPLLFPLIVCQQIILSLKYGNTAESAFAYSYYGMILCGMSDIDMGYNMGMLAINLLDLLKAKEVQSKIEVMVNYSIKHWKKHINQTLIPFQTAYTMGVETGDIEYANYSINTYSLHNFLSGLELTWVKSEIVKYTPIVIQMGQEKSVYFQQLFHQVTLNLLAQSFERPDIIVGEAFNEHLMLAEMQSKNDGNGLGYLYFFKLMLSVLFGEYDLAIDYAFAYEAYIGNNLGGFVVPQFYFYNSLARLAVLVDKSIFQRIKIISKVRSNQKKMKIWSKYAPMNHAHKYYLVEAELGRILGKDKLVIDYYDKAILLAKENEYIHEAALAYELAAKFYLSKDKELTARAYMQEAYYHYQLWEATAKVKDLERRYPQLLANQGKTKDTKNIASITTTGSGSNLDIATVMKATQAISGEIMLDNLLASLMKILIENAGAQRGYLILANQGQLLIEAEGTIDGQQVTLLKSTPINNCENMSQSIVNYVARTQENVVLNDATKAGQFTNDIYIKQNQPKSILCVPLINQGQLISIVYLENNLTTGAFTPERVEILRLLSGQAAISLQNAKLYTEVINNEKRLVELNQAYQRFVPSQFLQFLEKSSIIDVKLGDQVQLEMSILFSDIRDFTSISEKMTPEENFKFINSYLSRMESAIIENHGFIDKYIGDAIMALFSGEADNAVKAGISMLERLKIYNQNRINSGYQPIQNGIGINTGSLMLGTVGGQNRMDGTVISDAVNLASRVESLTKNYGVALLITEQTYTKLQNPNNYAIRIIDNVKVKGKSQSVTVYEVFDADIPEIKDGKLATLPIFIEALSIYNQGNLAGASQLFADCWQRNPGDVVTKIYFERCQKGYGQNSLVGENWASQY